MKNNIKKILNLFKKVIPFVLIAVLLFSLISLIHQKSSGEKCPTLFGFGIANVVTGSMEPTIPIGSLIVIQEKDEYNVKDIVTFRSENNCVTHRIVEIGDESVRTQGDANNRMDDPISKEDIIGKVIFILPSLGKILTSLFSIEGIIAIVAISFLAYLTINILKRKGQDENE